MDWIRHTPWLIPALPLCAAGVIAVTRRGRRKLAATLAIGALGLAFLLSVLALIATLPSASGEALGRSTVGFDWLDLGGERLRLGWVLDPLGAVMLLMVSLVSLVIFIYSVGYMADDANFTRFFGFLALFAAAMLGLVIANNLLLLFVCWELVGLASYLLIGFWFPKPSAAAAAKKAFITTRIGDLGLFLGMLWLYSAAGTLSFYDQGNGCLEQGALTRMAAQTTVCGLGVSTALSLLMFWGAAGKSGQFPLHVWLPDAMEGPTPVSALIHAATMVAAGVFLMARVYPLLESHPPGAPSETAALQVVTWIGALTAVFAALIAVAQTDIKRILAYSTVSQLGFMMLGLGVGGVAVGMFHLVAHAFFKALLFLGAGSVIHGLHEEQDIRRMGGLRKFMPLTFVTYAVGMLALAGFPLLFSGFWSKDEILHAAHAWPVSRVPFYLGLLGAALTAFYMTRQVCLVFFGSPRGNPAAGDGRVSHIGPPGHARTPASHDPQPHESPAVMTIPLAVLAVFAVLFGFLGTPAWPWFQGFLEGQPARFAAGALVRAGQLPLMAVSAALVLGSIGAGWWLYGRRPVANADEIDVLERWRPRLFAWLRDRLYVDEFYAATVIHWHDTFARLCDALDRWWWGGWVLAVSYVTVGLSWAARILDEYLINPGFDAGCRGIADAARMSGRAQDGRVQNYLRALALALTLLLLLLTWSRFG